MPGKKRLLIGPLPPGWGGARVTFKIFYDYLKENQNNDIMHFDLPSKNNRDKNPQGKVDHYKA